MSCHLDRMLRSDCSYWKSGVPLIGVNMTQSSANSLTVELMLFGKSLICIRKSIGPGTVPWDTPDLTWMHSDSLHLQLLFAFF